jgi:hypothetical protein
MKNEQVDNLIKLAWLEGWISTHGAYEKAVAKREARARVAPQAKAMLVSRLESALGETSPRVPLTVGGLLSDLRTTRMVRPQEIFARIGISRNLYKLMEHDAISPLKISANVWKRLMKLLSVPADEMTEMIRRTHQLVFFRPSFKSVLARYSSRKKKAIKTSELEKAYSELYAKAELSIPADEKNKLDTLLESIKSVN